MHACTCPQVNACCSLGLRQVIPAFDEAVAGMAVGGVRRVEVLGEIPELGYPRDRAQRFVSGFK